MVKLKAMISMELEGVKDVKPVGDDFQYLFSIACTSCRESHPKTVSISQTDEAEISGSKGSANFVWRCGNCKKEHSANFIPPIPSSKSSLTATYSAASSGQPQPFIALDCRGLEITAYHFSGRWRCTGEESGEAFEFDLDEIMADGGDEGRWDDYDEKAGAAVGISEMKSAVQRM